MKARKDNALPRKVDLRHHTEKRDAKVREIERRKNDLLEHNFRQAWINKVFANHPYLFSIDTVSNTLDWLSERGFHNPHKMIETLPALLGYDKNNIEEKITFLQKRGFQNPTKMIETLPQILGYRQENMDEKLHALEKMGFNNPIPVIERLPAILGLRKENIREKLHILESLERTCDSFIPTELMEKEKLLFSTKKEKLLIITDIIKDYCRKTGEFDTSFMGKLLKNTLEDLMVAYIKRTKGERIDQLLTRVKEIKKQPLSKKQKRHMIKYELKSKRMEQMYFRAYPEK